MMASTLLPTTHISVRSHSLTASSPEECDSGVSSAPRTSHQKSPMMSATMKEYCHELSLTKMLFPRQGAFESFRANLEPTISNKRRSISFLLPSLNEQEPSRPDSSTQTKRRRFERRNSKTAAMLSNAVMWVTMDELEEDNKTNPVRALKTPLVSQEDHWAKVEALLNLHSSHEVESSLVEPVERTHDSQSSETHA